MRAATTAVFFGLSLLIASPALAQITIEEVIEIARDNGMDTFREVERDDRRWQVEGRDAQGQELEIDIDPENGDVLDIDYD